MDSYVSWALLFFLMSAVASLLIHYYYVRRSHKTFPPTLHAFIVLAVFICVLPFPLLVIDLDAGLGAGRAAHDRAATSRPTPLLPPAMYSMHALQDGGNSTPTPTPQTAEPTTPVPTTPEQPGSPEVLNPEEGWLHPLWLVIFFATQIMAWIVLPIAQEYDLSGHFTPKARFLCALKENAKLYIVLGVVVGVLLGYIIVLKGIHTIGGIANLVLAAANAFGMLLIVIFLSCGLVGVPKMLFRSANPHVLLRMHYYKAPDLQEQLDIAKLDLSEVRAALTQMEPRIGEEDREDLTSMLEKIADAERTVTRGELRSRGMGTEAEETTELPHSKLVGLNAKMKHSIKLATRLNYEWAHLIRECERLDAIIKGEGTNTMSLIRRPVYYIAAVICFILTMLVLWSELVVPFQALIKKDMSVIELVVRNKTTSFVGSVTFLFYMAACSYWATFQFRLFDTFHVVPAISDAASLCFTTTFLTRLILPLCYNFLWAADLTTRSDAIVYSAIFGRMDVVDFLGTWFNTFIPVFIPVMAALIQFKVFDKLLVQMGIYRYDPTDVSHTVGERVNDGRRLVAQQCGREMVEAQVNCSSKGDASLSPTAVATVAKTTTAPKERGQRYAEYKARKAAESTDFPA